MKENKLYIVFTLIALIIFLPTYSAADIWTSSSDDSGLMNYPDTALAFYTQSYHDFLDKNTDPKWAEERLEQLAVRYPHHSRILLMNALIAKDNKHQLKAQHYLDQILAHHTIHPEATILRAELAIDDGNLNLAKRILNKQISLVPNQSELYETLASVYFLEKDYGKAMDNMKMAYELGAPQGRIKYHLGLIEEQKGRKQRAMGYYKQALISEPPFQQAKARLDALEAEFKNTKWLEMKGSNSEY